MSANIIKNTILLSIFTLALLNNLIAQTNYKMTVVEESNYDDNTHQLSVYIESTSSEFELTSYQCALGFNQDLFSSNLEFSYIEGSSDLINEPNLYVGIDDVDGQKELTFVSYVGNDIISKEKTLVGKFIIEGANSGAINTVWDFDGTISTIVTGEDFANITNASNHSSTEKIEDELLADESLPTEFGLSQNYPNPFNPTTNVKVEMKAEGNASLKVYNLIGEEVLNVFEGELLAGIHEMNINASNLPSGVYIYQLNVDNKYTDVKKMSLIK
ncbi:MAG: T9SS type A sorting domain-containing protein [Ignavibacteriae bacterium]|nr:T9SS type A sorting domain-containing protein [Ignavibacteriota bacterium]